MKTIILCSILIFSVLVITASGLISNASAQVSTSHVVINEIDTNPLGDDAKSISEWVELYNPTNSKIDISGWKIASTTVMKKTMTIPLGTVIEPGKFLTYSYEPLWFTDTSEFVELRDKNDVIVDKTPLLSDMKNDYTSWQRIYDGYDLDASDDWKFSTSTAGSSNGKLLITEDDIGVSISVFPTKSSYLFGETAVIQGNVSQQVFIVKPYFHSDQIIVKISGPNFDKTISLYPDLNLNYKTTLNLNQVLGINEGLYSVSVSYGNATSQTSFSVGNKIIVEDIKKESTLSIITDKSQYIPGNTISVTGSTTKVIPFEGLKFTVKDPTGKIISTGNLYPINGKFFTSVFLTTVNPVYGTYQISGQYFDKSSSALFEVVQDTKETKMVSLWTDKDVYALGETVMITGRVNNVWVGSLDLEIIQTKNAALGSSELGGGNSGFKILDVVRTAGDGFFAYSFKIPESDTRLGDYKISVSKEVGSASKIIHAITNPGDYVADSSALSLSTDKVIYDLGDTMKISGFIANPESRSSFETPHVKISLSHEDGSPLEIIALPPGAQTRQNNGLTIAYELAAIPDSSGRFSVQTSVSQTAFTQGTYLIKAEYAGLTKTIIVGIVDPLKLNDGALLSLNKQVFGLGETVQLTGLIPPTSDNSVSISLTKPDGSTINFGATLDNQHFSWSWITPTTEKPLAIKLDDRSITTTNYGVYRINVSIPSHVESIFFKVSSDPQHDSLSLTPLYVSTEKSLYKAGEKLNVIGNVIKRIQGLEGLVIPDRVTILVLDSKPPYKQIHEATVYPDQGGNFKSSFELPITIFHDGEYKVKALYLNKKSESTFSVTNDFSYDSSAKLSLLLATDKSEYHPGDTVIVSGKPNKLIYLEKFDVSVIKKSDTDITCGSFICGTHLGPVTTIRPSSLGSFSHQIQISNSTSSLGSYEITVDAGFEIKSIQFDVVPRPIIKAPEESSSTIIEKVIRIPDDKISIITNEKTIQDKKIVPKVISGSLLTTRDDQSNVNLRVTSESGMCIIGPEENCLVKDSTRKPGQIYDIVSVDGISLKVRYSGPDVRLEKFNILPASSTGFLPNENWNVDVIKDVDQISRFYYKINYKPLE
ncbi:MAG: lamin tail domain-containing protein [Nitrosopumilus sp.]|nr:lamin tail domain-containing protein [Nitrosopumilus sp.]